MAEPYRAVIIGCGSIGGRHANGYRTAGEVDLVAASDPNGRSLDAFLKEYEIPSGYADFREMLDKERPDLVDICTWHLLHAPQTVAAAEYQPKGILCEKPMAVDLDSADRMIDACASRGVKLAISHQRRFHSSWTKARELVAEGAVGRPQMVTARAGEGLLNCGTHEVDAIRYLLGDPEAEWVMGAVERKTDRYERDVKIEDRCMGLIAFEGGVQALIQSDLTRDWSVEDYRILGTEGMMDVSSKEIAMLNGGSGGWNTVEPEVLDAWAAQSREMVGWIEGRSGHRGEAAQARRTTELLMGIYQSARNHEVVRMPITEKGYPLDMMVAEGKLPLEEPGRYDIRGFLRFEPDEKAHYTRLRHQGMSHRDVLKSMGKRG